jgi:hypothetical protein
MPNYRHFCKEWDFMEIDADSPEYECCICNIDSDGRGPKFLPGDRVYVHPMRQEATVIRQMLQYDQSESFWGNLELQYDDGIKGISHSWQVKKVEPRGN